MIVTGGNSFSSRGPSATVPSRHATWVHAGTMVRYYAPRAIGSRRTRVYLFTICAGLTETVIEPPTLHRRVGVGLFITRVYHLETQDQHGGLGEDRTKYRGSKATCDLPFRYGTHRAEGRPKGRIVVACGLRRCRRPPCLSVCPSLLPRDPTGLSGRRRLLGSATGPGGRPRALGTATRV